LASAADKLSFEVKKGESVTGIIAAHCKEIRGLIPEAEQWRYLSAEQVCRKLLQDNLGELPHGIHPRNQVVIGRDGSIAVLAGAGKPPETFASRAQMLALATAIPEVVQDHLEDMARQGVIGFLRFTIDADGQRLVVGGRTYQAEPGLTFEGREHHFHVSGKVGDRRFSVAVWPFRDVPFAFPPNPFFRETMDGWIKAKAVTRGSFAQLLGDGQLSPHEEHFHITRKFDDPAWQNIVAMSASAQVDKLQQGLAQSVQVYFIKEHLFISSTDSARDLEALKVRLDRAWRGLNAGLAGPQMNFVLTHNALITPDGKVLHLGDRMLTAGDGLKLGFCRNHIHVLAEDVGAADNADGAANGMNLAVTPPASGQPLVLPDNLFVTLQGDRLIQKTLSPELGRALAHGHLAATDGVYHVGAGFQREAVEGIRAALTDRAVHAEVRASLKARLSELQAAPVPINDEKALFASLADIGQRLLALAAEAALAVTKAHATTADKSGERGPT
jgi:hypothetical protein